MAHDAPSPQDLGLAEAVTMAAARLEAITEARASAARAAAEGWEGATRARFERERSRQSALAAHLVAHGRRLAAELET